jgi:hypothetical protein
MLNHVRYDVYTLVLRILYQLLSFQTLIMKMFIDIVGFHTYEWDMWNVQEFILFLISQWKMRMCKFHEGMNYVVEYGI